MDCKSCVWNGYRKAGVPYCILPRCLYQVERGGVRCEVDREAEAVHRFLSGNGKSDGSSAKGRV